MEAPANRDFAARQAEQGIDLEICQYLGSAMAPGSSGDAPVARGRTHSHLTRLMLQSAFVCNAYFYLLHWPDA